MFSYFGICDFPSHGQSLKTARFFDELCEAYKIRNRKLMIGVMMSYSTLTNEPSDFTDVFPKKEEIASIFIDHPSVFNTLHYADYAGKTTVWNLLHAVRYGGNFLHAIQLDMIWPNVSMIRAFRKTKPDIKIVLQVNRYAMEESLWSPELVALRLKMYGDGIDYVLLDRSHGRGIEMDAEFLLTFVRKIREELPKKGITVAGGLGPHTIHLVEPIAREFPSVSTDMQGKLRPSGNLIEPIDWEMADSALIKAFEIFSQYINASNPRG